MTAEKKLIAQKLGKNVRYYLKVILFLLPAMVPLTVFWIYPAIESVHLSLTDWNYVSPTYNYVGLDKYVDVLTSKAFAKAAQVTFSFALWSVLPSLFLGLMLALFVFRNRIANGLLKFLFFSPWVTPLVAVSIVWTFIFDSRFGLVNYLITLLGFPKVPFLDSSKYALIPIIVVSVWSSVGWNMIFFLGALSRVPKELYEAAKVDGVGPVRTFAKVTLPLVSPTTLFLVVVSTINSLQAYAQIKVMTNGGPSGSTRTLLFLYWRKAFEEYDIGTATAVAVILILITAILSGLQFFISKKYVYYN